MKLNMPLKKRRKFGHKSQKHAYCAGYTDEQGNWNNGFICPKWGEPDQQYCCGTDTHKFCCPEASTAQPLSYVHRHTPLLIGVLVCVSVLVSLGVLIICCLCHGCPVHKSCKKRCQKGSCRPRSGQSVSYLNRQFDFVSGQPPGPNHYYSGLVLANMNSTTLQHPGYPPPSYPSDEYSDNIHDSEKQPLTPVQDDEDIGDISETDIRVAMWLQHAGMLSCNDSEDEPYVIFENTGGDACMTPVHSIDRRRYCLDDSLGVPSDGKLKHYTHTYDSEQRNSCALSPSISVKTM